MPPRSVLKLFNSNIEMQLCPRRKFTARWLPKFASFETVHELIKKIHARQTWIGSVPWNFDGANFVILQIWSQSNFFLKVESIKFSISIHNSFLYELIHPYMLSLYAQAWMLFGSLALCSAAAASESSESGFGGSFWKLVAKSANLQTAFTILILRRLEWR